MPPPEAPAATPDGSAHNSLIFRLAYGLGAGGLALAAASDGVAVAGRHLGLHLLGSIEMTQAAIVMLACGAMLIATLSGHHACVHMLTSRLADHAAARIARIADLVSALLALALAAGSFWLLRDTWGGFEQTELLHIPLRWLRVLWLGALGAMAIAFLVRAVKGRPA